MAYKFPALVAYSQIKSIYTEVSRSGRITYVAEINPVVLQGSKIGKATLHNYVFIRSLKLDIGDEVVIKKAGDVIPQITQKIKSSDVKEYEEVNYCCHCQKNTTHIFQKLSNRAFTNTCLICHNTENGYAENY